MVRVFCAFLCFFVCVQQLGLCQFGFFPRTAEWWQSPIILIPSQIQEYISTFQFPNQGQQDHPITNDVGNQNHNGDQYPGPNGIAQKPLACPTDLTEEAPNNQGFSGQSNQDQFPNQGHQADFINQGFFLQTEGWWQNPFTLFPIAYPLIPSQIRETISGFLNPNQDKQDHPVINNVGQGNQNCNRGDQNPALGIAQRPVAFPADFPEEASKNQGLTGQGNQGQSNGQGNQGQVNDQDKQGQFTDQSDQKQFTGQGNQELFTDQDNQPHAPDNQEELNSQGSQGFQPSQNGNGKLDRNETSTGIPSSQDDLTNDVDIANTPNMEATPPVTQASAVTEGIEPESLSDTDIRVDSNNGSSIFTSGAASSSMNVKPNPAYFVSLPEPPVCGSSNVSLGKVVGGENAKLGDFPWMALLGYKPRRDFDITWLCGGSLVSTRHILTAAHCVPEVTLYVRLGELDLASEDEGATPMDFLVVQKIKHEQYQPKPKNLNDIAVLVLDKEVQYTELIKPICIPRNRALRSQTFERYNPMIAGWGHTEFRGTAATHLQRLQVPVVTQGQCATSYKEQTIDERVICAGYTKGGKDACQGDSGGPLMQPIQNPETRKASFYQIGVVSYGKKCAEAGFPGVYTRVTHFAPWLEEKITGRTDIS